MSHHQLNNSKFNKIHNGLINLDTHGFINKVITGTFPQKKIL